MRGRFRRKNTVGLVLLLFAVGFAAFFWIAERNFRPIIQTAAEYRSRMTAEEAITSGFESVMAGFQGETFVTVVREETGVQSVEVNMQAVNQMKLQISAKILANLRAASNNTLEIPIGTLFGSTLLSGRGPTMHYQFLPQGSVSTRIVSSFTSCGINQTRHQILLTVNVKAGAMLSPYEVNVEVPAEYVLAETILVGTVPESYTSVLTGDDELLGKLNDYQATP